MINQKVIDGREQLLESISKLPPDMQKKILMAKDILSQLLLLDPPVMMFAMLDLVTEVGAEMIKEKQ